MRLADGKEHDVAVYPYMLLRLPSKFRHNVRVKDAIVKKLLVIVEWLVST